MRTATDDLPAELAALASKSMSFRPIDVDDLDPRDRDGVTVRCLGSARRIEYVTVDDDGVA